LQIKNTKPIEKFSHEELVAAFRAARDAVHALPRMEDVGPGCHSSVNIPCGRYYNRLERAAADVEDVSVMKFDRPVHCTLHVRGGASWLIQGDAMHKRSQAASFALLQHGIHNEVSYAID